MLYSHISRQSKLFLNICSHWNNAYSKQFVMGQITALHSSGLVNQSYLKEQLAGCQLLKCSNIAQMPRKRKCVCKVTDIGCWNIVYLSTWNFSSKVTLSRLVEGEMNFVEIRAVANYAYRVEAFILIKWI